VGRAGPPRPPGFILGRRMGGGPMRWVMLGTALALLGCAGHGGGASGEGQIVGEWRAPPAVVQQMRAPHSGLVVVDCMIETDGQPTDCHVLRSEGGEAFAAKTLAWLTGKDRPHYKADMHNGVAVRERHSWVITFMADKH